MLNQSGLVPILKLITYNGNTFYYRHCFVKDFMKIFQGIGVSISILKKLDKTKLYLIRYTGSKTETIYKSSIKQFLESNKEYNNEGVDLQKFVSFSNMEKLHTKELNK